MVRKKRCGRGRTTLQLSHRNTKEHHRTRAFLLRNALVRCTARSPSRNLPSSERERTWTHRCTLAGGLTAEVNEDAIDPIGTDDVIEARTVIIAVRTIVGGLIVREQVERDAASSTIFAIGRDKVVWWEECLQ